MDFQRRGEKLKKGDKQMKLAIHLFSYDITLHTTVGVSPAELLMGKRLRSALDLIKPCLHNGVEQGQE